MVRQSSAAPLLPEQNPQKITTTVKLSEVFSAGLRLEASVFNAETRNAVDELESSGLPLLPLYGQTGLCNDAHNAFRFRRIYVDSEFGLPFLSSSDIINLKPKTDNYLSKKFTKRLDELLVKEWDVLISCSGTVGNVSLAGATITGMALSQHVIRLRARESNTAGYVTAFLRSQYGRLQLTHASYGSVVTHIEPEHLTRVIIPNIDPVQRDAIGSLMCKACEHRDEANRLLDSADSLLHELLDLPYLKTLAPHQRQTETTTVKASQLLGRLEAGFHDVKAREAIKLLKSLACELTVVGDKRVTREIRAITKFRKRVYVPNGGIPLLSSKQLFQVDPVDVKGLAKGAHTKDLPEISLEQNMIAATRSGTIGRVQIIPKYMESWTASEHATRFIAAEDMNPGYLYAWLASDYGNKLIKRYSYGSVILEVDLEMFSSVPIPLPERAVQDEIGNLVLHANELRDLAWRKEQDAIGQIENLVQGKGD